MSAPTVRHAHRRGTSLLELMVVVALIGVVALLARTILEAVRDAEGMISTMADAHRTATMPERVWRDLLGHAATTESGGVGVNLVGNANEVLFTSACRDGRGYRVSCVVHAHVSNDGESLLINAHAMSWTLQMDNAVQLRYLDASAGSARWIEKWSESLRTPAGIALIGSADTLVNRYGVGQ